ncbi:MAG: UDP-glucose 4-epimerase GalE [Alphaproteobacteria bacterium]|nr:UDP-glucose 4-epimerase GalE [Alphaproteobacteria bacterium]
MSKVLVTGGAGYIGSHAVLALRDAGREVVVLDDLSTGFREAVPADIAFYQGDIADRSFVHDVLTREQISAVMHFAGSMSVPESVAQPGKYYLNNTCGTLSLAETCIAAGIAHFIFSSSSSVYGEAKICPCPEDLPPAPVSPYAASKWMSEVMLQDLGVAHPSFRSVRLRYFNVAGADPLGRAGQRNPEAAGLVKLAVETALGRRQVLEVFGDDYATRDGTCERDYIHITDLASAHLAALNYLEAGSPSTTLNLGYGKGYTVLEVIAALETVLGRKLETRRAARRPGDPARYFSDVTRLRATLDWSPQHEDLHEILRSALSWAGALPA